jgi:hypothetical protein
MGTTRRVLVVGGAACGCLVVADGCLGPRGLTVDVRAAVPSAGAGWRAVRLFLELGGEALGDG